MGKETSGTISTIAASLVHFGQADLHAVLTGTPDEQGALVTKIRALAGSCLSQDETPGPGPVTLMRRVSHERTELSDRLKKLTAYLNKGAPGASETQRSLLNAQKFCMSEYLAVLDQRLQDLSLAENSESNHGQ